MTLKRFQWLLAFFTVLGCGTYLIAQNPVSVAQVGTTTVTTTLPVSGTVAATQSGTWTVQPGNTANTTAWKVDGSAVTQPVSGTVTANQGGTWTVQPGNTANTTAWKVDGSAVTQPVSGTVTANQGGTWTVQPGNTANTTAWKVDGSAVTQPVSGTVSITANSSVNVAQMNGVTVTMGAGATGTGVQRVNDVGSSATGAAPPASAHFIGGLGSGATGGFVVPITVCDTNKVVNISTATTTLMVTGVSGRQVRICAFHLFTTAANNVAWIEGTGATCGTGTAGMAGGTTAASGYGFVANQGIAQGSGFGEVLATATTGDSVCIITSAATQLSGFIKYAIY